MPPASAWWWAAAAAGLPLALPFAARSIASQAGEGALATFNYAWKLVELPLMLAIQLVATLAFPRIARALAAPPLEQGDARSAMRSGFALAWVLGCAAAAGLSLAAPAVAQLLFGWGRMQPQALAQVAEWGRIGAWGLLPQACIAVGLTVLAAQRRMGAAVLAYAAALLVLLGAGAAGISDGAALMLLMNGLLTVVAVVVLAALGPLLREAIPWGAFAAGAAALIAAQVLSLPGGLRQAGMLLQLMVAVAAALAVVAVSAWASADLRAALRR